MVTNKPCGEDGVHFEKLGAKDIRSIGISLKIPRSRSSKKSVFIDAIKSSYDTRVMYDSLESPSPR